MSAKQPGRPEFEKMVKLIEQNPALLFLSGSLTVLPVTPWTRGKLNGYCKKMLLPKLLPLKEFICPNDNALISAVEFGMANQYIRDLSTNVKRGNKTKLEKGELPARLLLATLITLPKQKRN